MPAAVWFNGAVVQFNEVGKQFNEVANNSMKLQTIQWSCKQFNEVANNSMKLQTIQWSCKTIQWSCKTIQWSWNNSMTAEVNSIIQIWIQANPVTSMMFAVKFNSGSGE